MIIKINIETLVFLSIILIIFIWFIWFKFTKWLNKRKYNPENDIGKKGEERRRELGTREPAIKTADSDSWGYGELEKRGILSAADVIVDGKTGNSNGKPRKKFRNPFRRRN